MQREFSGREVLELISESNGAGGRRLRGDLGSVYGVRVREYPDRYMLTYGQIDSAECRFEPVVRVCRQLIVSRDLTRILHRSFDRFFNLGEDPESHLFDFSKAVCEEKLDGALVGLYHMPGEGWTHCSKSLAYAEGNLNASLKYRTFGELIDAEVDLRPFIEKGNPDLSYIFELTSRWDPHVVRYPDTQLHLLAARDRESGEYADIAAEAARIGWPRRPKEYRFASRTEILRNVRELPMTEEGYVCRIGQWRIKVKSPAHVAAQSLKDSMAKSETAVIQIVHACEDAEYLSCFPEDAGLFAPWIAVREAMPEWFGRTYRAHLGGGRAQFAASLAKADVPQVLRAALFKMYENGGEFRPALEALHLKDSVMARFYRTMRGVLDGASSACGKQEGSR